MIPSVSLGQNITEKVTYIKNTSSFTGNDSSSLKHIIILGSGFAGVEVLKRLEKKFKNKGNISITMVK